jgi:hypothetical protein
MGEKGTLNPYVGVRILRPQPETVTGDGEMIISQPRIATLVDWVVAPDWLTVEEACLLTGWDHNAMQEIVRAGGVDLNEDSLIERESLLEFQEAVALVGILSF